MVYGADYQDETKKLKNNHVLNVYANNIAHRQFNFKSFDSSDLWDTASNQLTQQTIDLLIQKIHHVNKDMHLIHINKNSRQLNMLPTIIINTPVEYFMIIDGEFHRAYFIYITPYEVGAY